MASSFREALEKAGLVPDKEAESKLAKVIDKAAEELHKLRTGESQPHVVVESRDGRNHFSVRIESSPPPKR